MAAATGSVKKPKSMMRLYVLCGLLMVGGFAIVFISTNNIKVSFDTFTSKEKYPAQAFVKKRTGLLSASIKGMLPSANITTGTDLSAKLEFDADTQKVNVSVHDQNNNPASRIMVIGSLSRVGETRIAKQFNLKDYGNGNFRSDSLDLTAGGWVLMVSAYNPHTLNREKLLFHTERAIFLKAN